VTEVQSLSAGFEALLPSHKGGLYIGHNNHLGSYLTAEQAIAEDDANRESGTNLFDWVSDEQKQKAIETGNIWTLQWYPDTPVGFCMMAAADLGKLLAAVSAGDKS
jgi:hypothetical protein